MLCKFQKIDENVFGASMPESIEDIQKLKKMGIKVIVSLETMPTQIEVAAKKAGIRVWHLPLDDAMPPTIAEVKRFLKIVNSSIAQGKKVFVHCYKGTGRTREMLAFYLIRRGVAPILAHSKVGGVETLEQKKFLLEYGARISAALKRLNQIKLKRKRQYKPRRK